MVSRMQATCTISDAAQAAVRPSMLQWAAWVAVRLREGARVDDELLLAGDWKHA